MAVYACACISVRGEEGEGRGTSGQCGIRAEPPGEGGREKGGSYSVRLCAAHGRGAGGRSSIVGRFQGTVAVGCDIGGDDQGGGWQRPKGVCEDEKATASPGFAGAYYFRCVASLCAEPGPCPGRCHHGTATIFALP